MAIEVIKLERVFNYSGMALPDPGATLSPEDVRAMYAAAYPEILTAAIEGPEEKGGKMHYTFRKAAGAKG